jgi:ADP-ribose pyrophosphatase YjhB (NUDIX family)
MDGDESRQQVADELDALDGTYDSFDVQQTTVSVPTEAYEHARAAGRRGVVEAGVRVEREGRTLAVQDQGGWRDPVGAVEADEDVEAAARRLVREATGVACHVRDLQSVAIVGFHDESDPDRPPVYRLRALFAGEYVSGAPGGSAAWRREPPQARAVAV